MVFPKNLHKNRRYTAFIIFFSLVCGIKLFGFHLRDNNHLHSFFSENDLNFESINFSKFADLEGPFFANGVAVPPEININFPGEGEFFPSPQSITITATATDNDGNVSHVDFYIDNNFLGTDASAPYSMNWIIPANGTYEIKATAIDNDGDFTSSVVTIYVGQITLCSKVNTSSDDAEENAVSGSVSVNSSDLELIFDGVNQVVGMRFNNLNIPQCAVINSAYIQFTANGSTVNIDPCNLEIFGEDSDNAATFSNSSFNISSRPKTSVFVTWSPPLWVINGESGPPQQTIDIGTVIQETVQRPGFTPNSSIAIIIEGIGKRRADSFDFNALTAPELCIEFMPVFPDDDGDGVCNANDLCPGGPEPGTACDDGNTSTYDDTIDSNCNCTGTLFDCPSLPANIGDPCDDGNPETSNDVIDSNCICIGSFDCPALQANFGDPCDDGNPETANDLIDSNCVCIGSYDCPILQANFGDPCDDGISGTFNDSIDVNCNCFGIYECPDLMAGFCDPCDDGNPNSLYDAIDSTCNCIGVPFIYTGVAAGSDDAEESPAGTVDVESSDLELTDDVDIPQVVGIRFTDLGIPQCAVINKAYIQFKAKNSVNINPCNLVIYGEDSDDAGTFINEDFNISDRPKTDTFVEWSPADWQNNQETTPQQTADLTPIVQEIINRGGFTDSSAIAFIFEGEGMRRAYSFEQADSIAPKLYIEFLEVFFDDDNDGVCNVNDFCVGPEPGTTCDDGLAETYDDAIDSTCVCAGILYDCPTLFANFGDSCDDGNPETPNDFVSPDCECVGGFDCPDLSVNFGDPCDDGIPGTYDDIIDSNCLCVGIWDCPDLMTGFGYPCDDGNASTLDDMIDLNCNCVGSPTVYVKVAASSDDAEEKETGQVSLTSSDLELVYDGNNQTVGLRFTNLNIPQGVIIDTAFIQFTSDEIVNVNPCNLQIYGEDSDNAQTFLEVNSNISIRPKTSATVAWSPDDWLLDESAGMPQRTNNLRAIIQEIVNRNGFSTNSSIAIIMEGTGSRIATAYEGDPAKAPELYIRYDFPAENEQPSHADKQQLLVYPVPAKDHLNISFTCQSTDDIPVQILDLNGKLLFRDWRSVQIGKNNLLFENIRLQNGVYIVQLYFDNSVHTAKFTVMK